MRAKLVNKKVDLGKMIYEFESNVDDLKIGEYYQIEKEKKLRSLNANSYLWLMCDKIANAIGSDKDSVYLEMLERYGVFTHIVVKPNVVNKVAEQFKLVRELGEVTINGTTGIQLQVYYGSHTYDTKEMSNLLNGVVSEAQFLGIQTLEDIEINRLIREWQK